jgi:hypothetical protein
MELPWKRNRDRILTVSGVLRKEETTSEEADCLSTPQVYSHNEKN